jgi:hypothetical protein
VVCLKVNTRVLLPKDVNMHEASCTLGMGVWVDMAQKEKFTKFNVAMSNITKLNLNPMNVYRSAVYRNNVTTPTICSCKQVRKSPGLAD